MAGIRVVLDSNVIVSGIVYPASKPGLIVRAWWDGNLDVAASRYILDEVRQVLPRLKRLDLNESEFRDLTDSLLFLVDLVEPDDAKEANLRDPSDQLILATFRAAGAQYLITGDKDLLALADRYAVTTPAEFWARHGG
jgi:putative PIN family toxin of toxin-antitoxin system